jgi:hypothetical protein
MYSGDTEPEEEGEEEDENENPTEEEKLYHDELWKAARCTAFRWYNILRQLKDVPVEVELISSFSSLLDCTRLHLYIDSLLLAFRQFEVEHIKITTSLHA